MTTKFEFDFNENAEVNKQFVLQLTDKVIADNLLLANKINKVFSANKKAPDKYNVVFTISNYHALLPQLSSALQKIKNTLTVLNLPITSVQFVVAYDGEPSFDTKQTNALIKLNNLIAENFNSQIMFPINSKIHFPEYFNLNELWEFNKVLNVNLSLNKIAKTINQANLSTYEKYLAVYSFVTKFVYTAEDKNEAPYISRKLIPVMSGEKIVCSGYATLLKALCQRVGIPCTNMIVKSPNNTLSHEINVVKITDKKYNIDGIMVADATADRHGINEENSQKNYNFHLLNFTDAKKYIEFVTCDYLSSKLEILAEGNFAQLTQNFSLTLKDVLRDNRILELYEEFNKIKFTKKPFTHTIAEMEFYNSEIQKLLATKASQAQILELQHKANMHADKIQAQNFQQMVEISKGLQITTISTEELKAALKQVNSKISFELFDPQNKTIDLGKNYLINNPDLKAVEKHVNETINEYVKYDEYLKSL